MKSERKSTKRGWARLAMETEGRSRNHRGRGRGWSVGGWRACEGDTKGDIKGVSDAQLVV
jgi:hypothetical protein